MVNAQEWLESQEQYDTKEKRSAIKELIISNKKLEGKLNLSDFINLKKLSVAGRRKDWEGFYQWLNINIVGINEKGAGKGNIKAAKRSEYPNLLSNYNCIGSLMNGIEYYLGKTPLDYTGKNCQNDHKVPVLAYDESKSFFHLANGNGNSFKCGNSFTLSSHQNILDEYEKLLAEWRNYTNETNEITGLNISSCSHLEAINCSNNQLNFDIAILAQYPNLEEIFLDNNKKIDGSLENLKNLKKLKILNIQGTSVDGDLEYLPLLEKLYISGSFIKSYEEVVNGEHINENNKEVEREINGNQLLNYKKKKVLLSEETKKVNSATNSDFQKAFTEFAVSHAKNKLKNLTVKQKLEIEKISNTLDLKEKIKEIEKRNLSLAQQWLNRKYPKNKEQQSGEDKENKDEDERSGLDKLEIREKDLKLKGQLDLSSFTGLKYLYCENNELTALDVSGLTGLKEIYCSNNCLTSDSLDLSGVDNLEKFSGNHNLFTNLKPFLNFKHLEHLELTDNDFHEPKEGKKQDLNLSEFKEFTNLESLWIGNYNRETKSGIYNRFAGSLEPLSELEKLKELEIGWTDIDDGLRYLPGDLKTIWCYNGKGYGTPENKCEKLVSRLRNFPVEGVSNFEGWLKKAKKFCDEKGENKIDLTNYKKENWESEYSSHYKDDNSHGKLMLKEWKSSLNNQYDCKSWKKNYDDQKKMVVKDRIYPELDWKENKNKISLSKEQLPIKLYNIEKDEVEKIEENKDIKRYAILSYSWGKSGTPEDIKCWKKKTKYKDKLTPSGYKSLYKAVKTCGIKELKINHLWTSEICIEQTNLKEADEEVSKMRQYYSNVDVTLVAIHVDLLEELSSSRFPKGGSDKQLILDWPSIIKAVTDSEWFTRSWCYQEGWLSKQTIFMFDNLDEIMLIDGRFLAAVWAFNNPNHTRYNKYVDLKEFYEHSKKIATPFGWTYYQDGYSSQDVVSLRLDEALRETRHRRRGIPVDAIYSILGLLPYGDKVKASYKPRICPECPGEKETEKCGHKEENKKWPIYTKDDVELALIKVMKASIESGYGEPLAWFGSGSDTKGKCWLPKVLDFRGEEENWEERQKNGSVDVKGGMDVKYIVT